MKKLVSAFLAGCAMCGILSGCNSSGVSIEEYNRVVSELEATKSKLESLNSNPDSFIPETESDVPAPTATPISSPTKVTAGVSFLTRNSEFFIEYSEIASKVVPGQPDGVYTYYEADAGKTYVDVCFAYTNKQSQSIPADEVITSAELKYKNQYTYRGFSTIEYDNRRSFTYTNITSIDPLTTEYLHYLFEVPSEVENSHGLIDITFTIDGKDFIYTVQ